MTRGMRRWTRYVQVSLKLFERREADNLKQSRCQEPSITLIRARALPRSVNPEGTEVNGQPSSFESTALAYNMHSEQVLRDRNQAPYLENRNGLGMRRKLRSPINVDAQLIPSYQSHKYPILSLLAKTLLTVWNILAVNSGNAAATPKRIMVSAANAAAAYIKYVSGIYICGAQVRVKR